MLRSADPPPAAAFQEQSSKVGRGSPSPIPLAPGQIDRALWLAVLAQSPAWLLRQLGPPEPARSPAGWHGWRIAALFPDQPVLCDHTCDLRLGDVIESVNGNALATPQAFAAAYAEAPNWDQVTIVRVRDGVRETVHYTIVARDAQNVAAAPSPAAPM